MLIPIFAFMPGFEDLKLNKQLLTAIAEMGYTTPSPVQLKAIPPILNGQDVLSVAQTGTGKTAAYLIPVIRKLNYPQGDVPRALIIVPTRELVLQVKAHADALAKHTGLRSLALYGGVGPKTQIEEAKKGVDIVISTPKRVMELYLEEHIVLKKIQYLVLDEAERLMDMGFMGQLNKVLEVVPHKRQNLLFSATMSDRVMRLSEDFLLFPTEVRIEPKRITAENVSQLKYFTPTLATKINFIEYLLQKPEKFRKAMVFCKTKANADKIANFLGRKFGEEQIRVIHGNKGQNSRINSINAFETGLIRVLVATDVAARGIDVSNVSHVINFDVPLIYEDYVHRIGRTGRADRKGDSITFYTDADKYHIEKIESLIKQEIPQKQLPQGVLDEKTSFTERQEMAMEIDRQKRADDPDFKGAFHDKKKIYPEKKTVEKKRSDNQGKGVSKRYSRADVGKVKAGAKTANRSAKQTKVKKNTGAKRGR